MFCTQVKCMLCMVLPWVCIPTLQAETSDHGGNQRHDLFQLDSWCAYKLRVTTYMKHHFHLSAKHQYINITSRLRLH